MLSYFTLPNSNHERKSSPIEKIIFVRSKFPSPCLKSHRSKFAAGRPGTEFTRPIHQASVALVARFPLVPRVSMMRPVPACRTPGVFA
jgi:hypothetical protein